MFRGLFSLFIMQAYDLRYEKETEKRATFYHPCSATVLPSSFLFHQAEPVMIVGSDRGRASVKRGLPRWFRLAGRLLD